MRSTGPYHLIRWDGEEHHSDYRYQRATVGQDRDDAPHATCETLREAYDTALPGFKVEDAQGNLVQINL